MTPVRITKNSSVEIIEIEGIPHKKCSGCKNLLPLTSYTKCTQAPHGLQYKCKACIKAYQAARPFPTADDVDAKPCNRCKIVKPLCEFKKKKTGKYGVNGICKICCYEWDLLYKERTKEERSAYCRMYAKLNAPKIRAYQRKHYEENRDECAAYNAEWTKRNRKRINKRNKERLQNDEDFRLRGLLRSRLSMAVLGNFKAGSAVEDLGCSVEDFKAYLESRFDAGMSWDNHGIRKGQWNIDHIMPLTAFDLKDRQHVLLACNYNNMQPLWQHQNVSKSDSLPIRMANGALIY